MSIENEHNYWQQKLANAQEEGRPSLQLQANLRIGIDGDHWCVLYGENLQDGVAGFGKSPHEAFVDFDKNFFAKLPSKV